MIATKIYREPNILHIKFKDRVTTTQFDMLHRSLPSVLRRMPPDFVFLSDFSALEEIDFSCWKPVAYLMDQLVMANVGEIVRVMPDYKRDIGCGTLSAFHYPASLKILVFSNLAEACNHLELDLYEALPDDVFTSEAGMAHPEQSDLVFS